MDLPELVSQSNPQLLSGLEYSRMHLNTLSTKLATFSRPESLGTPQLTAKPFPNFQKQEDVRSIGKINNNAYDNV